MSTEPGQAHTLCLVGCPSGTPGYQLKCKRLGKELLAVDATNSVSRWATGILSASLANTNRPAVVVITNLPAWCLQAHYDSSLVTAVLPKAPGEDHVSFFWATGRGLWGICIGETNFSLTMNGASFFVLRCKPGLYVWHSTTGG